jgi:hypothetical protein
MSPSPRYVVFLSPDKPVQFSVRVTFYEHIADVYPPFPRAKPELVISGKLPKI